MSFVPGSQQRHLRACMVCSIVQVQQRFIREGCPNCETFLGLQNHPEDVQQCTSQVFEGLITLADPSSSWVARWQRLDGYVPGVYAVKVVGQVSHAWLWLISDPWESLGIRYSSAIGFDLGVLSFVILHVAILRLSSPTYARPQHES